MTSPDARVNDLEEQLPGAGVENEDGAVFGQNQISSSSAPNIRTDGLGRQIALERLVDCNTVNIRVIDKPCVRFEQKSEGTSNNTHR